MSEKAYPLGDLRIPPEIVSHCMLSCHRAWFGNPKSLINGLAPSGNRYHVQYEFCVCFILGCHCTL